MPNVYMFLEDMKSSSDSLNLLDTNNTSLQYHQCVNIEDKDSFGSISFIPPDGEFELIKYTFKDRFKPLFQLSIEIIKKKETYEELQLSICSAYSPKTLANDVEVYIPVPCDSTDV